MLNRVDTAIAASATELAGLPPVPAGDLVLHPPLREVAGPQGRVAVEPRVMQILLALAAHGGAVMTRDALLAMCWPGMIVGDDSLHRAIVGARRALRDCGSLVTIDTIPRIGYRLLVPAAGQPRRRLLHHRRTGSIGAG